MAIHKVSADFYEHAYSLIAIHSSLEDYRLAYFLNLYLRTQFKKMPNIDFNTKQASFSIYEWEDNTTDTIWNLLSNCCKIMIIDSKKNNTLFNHHPSPVINYLIPEQKQIDYFLKIDHEMTAINTKMLLNKINAISQIITTYAIDPNQLKSKNNLII